MTVWVTGANGFIGRHLVRALADGGHTVHGIGHGAIEDVDRQHLGLAIWLNGEIDAANLNTLAGRSGAPSRIFHLAGGSSVGSSIAQPFEDFLRFISAAGDSINASERSQRSRIVSERCRLLILRNRFRNVTLKLQGQAVLPERGVLHPHFLQSTIVRPFSVYGPHLRKQLLWDVCSRLYRRERTLILGGTGGEVRDWTDVRDVVRLFAAIGELPQRENYQIFNGGCGLGTTVADLVNMLVKNWGGDIAVGFSGVIRSGDPFSLVADDAQLRRIPFGWQIPVVQGIAAYVQWFKEHVR